MTEPNKARVVSEHTPKVPPMPRYVVLVLSHNTKTGAYPIWELYGLKERRDQAEKYAENAMLSRYVLRAVVVEIAEGGAS